MRSLFQSCKFDAISKDNPMEVILNGRKIEAPEDITILELATREDQFPPSATMKTQALWFLLGLRGGSERRRGFVTSCGTL